MTRRAFVRIVLAVVIGLVEPHVEIVWKCRSGFEASEACVWARSLLPLGRVVAPLVVAPVALIILLALEWAWGRLVFRRR
jgi:hypothetical protein